MKNNNQTPVEWLIEEIENRDKIIDSETDDLVRGSMISYGYGDLYEQAKEMESKRQKKYDEMLEMLKICQQTTNSKQIYDEIEKLIKEATKI